MILMIHDEKDDGMVAIAEGVIAGELTPARTYEHQGKFLIVEVASHAQAHDLEELRKLGYRVATAEEQNKFTATKRKKSTLTERGGE